MKWPDEALERTMLADADAVDASHRVDRTTESSADCACHVRALLTRVRELEKREAELEADLGLMRMAYLTARQ